MTKQDFGPLGVVDLLTDNELRATMGHHFDHMLRDWYRGLDFMGFAGVGNGTGTLTIPGADSGYSWSLKLLAAQLSASGNLSVYPSDGTNVAPIGTVASLGTNNDCVIRWGSNQAVLKDQRNITLFAGAATIINWRLLVLQVPTEMQGKLN
jgi:hypothetical protein